MAFTGHEFHENRAVNVKTDFGAVGDGVADDAAAIQAALDSGRSVFIPAGRYRCGSQLVIGSSVQVIGEGSALWESTARTVLVFDAGVAGLKIATNDATGTEVNGVHLYSLSAVAGTDHGIQIEAPRITLRNVTVEGFGGHGLHWVSGGGLNANLGQFYRVRAYNNFGNGFNIGDAGADKNANIFHGISSVSNGGWGLYNNGDTNVFIKCHFDANEAGAVWDKGNMHCKDWEN